MFLLWCGSRVAVAKRPGRGLLAGLWSFPNVPGKLDAQQALDQAAAWGVRPADIVSSADREHIFTHVRWDQRGYVIRCNTEAGPFTWASRRQVDEELALPTAFRQFWSGAETSPADGSTAQISIPLWNQNSRTSENRRKNSTKNS